MKTQKRMKKGLLKIMSGKHSLCFGGCLIGVVCRIVIKKDAWAKIAAQRALTIQGEIRGEVTDVAIGLPTTTKLNILTKSGWDYPVTFDPGDGRTNFVGWLQLNGHLELKSGVTCVSSASNNGINADSLSLIRGNNSSYNTTAGHLVISGGELYAPQSPRRFQTERYATVDVVGGKFNMPGVEYLNALAGYGGTAAATLNVGEGGEFIVNELRLSQSTGAGGIINLNANGTMRVNKMRMDGSSYIATFNFNGGWLESRSSNRDFFGSYQSSANWANVSCKVLEGGAKLIATNQHMFIVAPLTSGAEQDGGVTVRGGNGKAVVFYGANTYNGPTRLENGSTVQVRAELNGLPTGTTLQVGANAEIGFNRWDDAPAYVDTTQTVARVEGHGRVFNNSQFHVTGAVAPVFDGQYGTLTFHKPCDLHGDLEITGDANGCGCVAFEANDYGKPDLSNLTLKVMGLASFDRSPEKENLYKILDAPNGYTGEFLLASSIKPWKVVYKENGVYLRPTWGLTVILR